MTRVLLTIVLFVLWANNAQAGEREDRREIQEQRQRVRVAKRRLIRCYEAADLTPCLESMDRATSEALLAQLLKESTISGGVVINPKRVRD